MLGMTVFESVLERLKAEALENGELAIAPATAERAVNIRVPSSAFAGLGAIDATISGAHAAAAYRDLAEDPLPPIPEPDEKEIIEPDNTAHLQRTTPEEIAEDLALMGNETIDDLLARRRAFARENHPDRAPTELRTNATLRMKIANMLIDETIRRINAERSLGLIR